MFDTYSLVIIISTFVLAGMVKGIIGLGLPTVSLAILTVAIDLPTAMALLLIPSFVTNVWQALIGGNGKKVILRIWPFILMAGVTVSIGSMSLTRLNLSLLSALLGGLLIIYSAISLGGIRIQITESQVTPFGIVLGVVNGILTGMTGSFVVPGVMYLQAIDLKRDELIQAMGMLFTISTVALGLALHQNQFLNTEHGILSSAALIPAIIGMVLGRRIRIGLSEKRFRLIFFVSLLVLGGYLAVNSLV